MNSRLLLLLPLAVGCGLPPSSDPNATHSSGLMVDEVPVDAPPAAASMDSFVPCLLVDAAGVPIDEGSGPVPPLDGGPALDGGPLVLDGGVADGGVRPDGGAGTDGGFISDGGVRPDGGIDGGWVDPRVIVVTYESTIPLDVGIALAGLFQQIDPTMRALLGAPTHSVALTVRYSPSLGGAGATYAPFSNVMTLSALPDTGLGLPGRVDARQLYEIVIHEYAHVFQDGLLDRGWSSWTAEGIAVFATALVAKQHPELTPPDSVYSVENLVQNLDHLREPGLNLGGDQYWAMDARVIQRYLGAGSLFLALAASQTSPQSPNATSWTKFNFVGRVLNGLMTRGGSLNGSEVLAVVDQLASGRLDGDGPANWLRRHPLTTERAALGRSVWGTVTQPYQAASPRVMTYVVFKAFERREFAFVPLNTGSCVGRVYDSSGAVRFSEVVPLTPVLTQYFNFAGAVGDGAAVVEIDCSAVGAGSTHFVVERGAPRDHTAAFVGATGQLVTPSATHWGQALTANNGLVSFPVMATLSSQRVEFLGNWRDVTNVAGLPRSKVWRQASTGAWSY